MTKVLLSLLMFLVFSCTSKFYVAPKMADCSIGGKSACYLIKNRLDENWLMVPEDIYKFDYEEGYLYRIKVKKIRLRDDFGNIVDAYQLVEILSKEEFKGKRQAQSSLEIDKYSLALSVTGGLPFRNCCEFTNPTCN